MNVRKCMTALAATTTLAGLSALCLTAPAQATAAGPAVAALSGATATAPARVAVANATAGAVRPFSGAAGVGAPARASAARPDGVINYSCGPTINVNGTTNRHLATSKPIGDTAWSRLEYGYDSKYGTVYWAHVWRAPKNSVVWLDWSDDGKHNWHRCGPYWVDGSQGAHDRWTWAVNWVHGREFRSCANVPRLPRLNGCTVWKP
ncbi:hypothetical protein [Streptomyces silvisoli]|uniref:Secreted protein n=1 Tax=Streptomyces silvisoli TaxID=3034235 RepID=A0ABT5ZSB2_9ACTN|nr:hypothetical protein [Streptomyces silvisoli]MDF3292696.1 hypothetical protein [Streptomyces silvisoli]